MTAVALTTAANDNKNNNNKHRNDREGKEAAAPPNVRVTNRIGDEFVVEWIRSRSVDFDGAFSGCGGVALLVCGSLNL